MQLTSKGTKVRKGNADNGSVILGFLCGYLICVVRKPQMAQSYAKKTRIIPQRYLAISAVNAEFNFSL